MQKEYRANLQYNITKKRNSFLLCGVLFLTIIGVLSVVLTFGNIMLAGTFIIFMIFPISLIPQIFKTYPTDNRVILKITDKDITAEKVTYKLKDVYKFRVIITLPYSRIDSENVALLNSVRDKKPSYEYMGNLDIVVKDPKTNKKKVVYTTIDNVIDAAETLISLGIKHHEIQYSIKKRNVKSEYDLVRDVTFKYAQEKKKSELSELSEKERVKQLL